MSQVDWSRAPEGATHYREGVATFYKQNDRAYEWNAGRWQLIANDLGEFRWSDQLLERPSPAWSGEGLPPVGTVCEVFGTVLQELHRQENTWRKAEVIAHTEFGGEMVAVAKDLSAATLAWGTSKVFRPIRTPEQIAADEREAELNRMVATVQMLDKGWARKVCAGLYDAGYRKQPDTK